MNDIPYINGCRPSKIDIRDYKIACATNEDFPMSFELAPCKVKNQGGTGSCVAHAMSEALEIFNKSETGAYTELSTEFIYGYRPVGYYQGVGMSLRDALKTLHKYGDPPESVVKGNHEVEKAKEHIDNVMKDDMVLTLAYKYHITSYMKLVTEQDIKHALMNYGPVVVNMKWYDKSYLTMDGIYEYDGNAYGNHAILIYGWNEMGWLAQNSWGTGWGRNGRFIIGYDFKFDEIWGLVDEYVADTDDIIKPHNSVFGSLLAKVFNGVINLVASLFRR